MDSPYRPVSKIATAETFTDIPEEGEAAATVRPVRSLTNSSRGSSGRGSSSGGDLRETTMAGSEDKNDADKKDSEAAVESKKGKGNSLRLSQEKCSFVKLLTAIKDHSMNSPYQRSGCLSARRAFENKVDVE